MKKHLLLLALLITTGGLFAQDELENTEDSNSKHEIRVNGLMLIVGAFEAGYEYNLNEQSSIGSTIFIGLTDDIDVKYLSPYYRVFFGKKYAAGFFFEGFGMLNNYGLERTITNLNTNVSYKEDAGNVTDFALGLGLGAKWISKRNFVFELNGGFGRNLFNSDKDISGSEFVGKFGFSFGYRF